VSNEKLNFSLLIKILTFKPWIWKSSFQYSQINSICCPRIGVDRALWSSLEEKKQFFCYRLMWFEISQRTWNLCFYITQLYSQECYTCLKSNVLLHFSNIYGGAKLQY
jgi:hypothetical protein